MGLSSRHAGSARALPARQLLSALLAPPRDEREVVGALAIIRNVPVPFGAPYSDLGIYDTEYRTVCDLTSRSYYLELTTAPNVILTEVDKLDRKPEAAVMTLEISGAFQPGQAPY